MTRQCMVAMGAAALLLASSSAFSFIAPPSCAKRVSDLEASARRSCRTRHASTKTDIPSTAVETGKKPASTRLHVQLGESFYDLTGWRKIHPAGQHWIDRFAERDATDVMTAFHSEDAFDRLRTLPVVKGKEGVEPSTVTKNFRAFRKELVDAGWFERVWYKDAAVVALQLGTFAAGIVLARINPWLGTLVMGIAHTTGGWLAHDMVHGRGEYCTAMRHYGALTCGLSSKWWSEKHNLHHAFTNVIGADEDIIVEPALWLWAPDDSRDRPWRKFQHLYWPLPFSLTFLLWRIGSVKTAIFEKLRLEGVRLALHYVLLAALVPLPVAIGHVFLGGWLTATIVTVTHTAEEFSVGDKPSPSMEDDTSYVETQFKTTRDAVCKDPLSEHLWGGMQYQLEHHLFPTMPRYKYRDLVPLVKKFAEDNSLEYKSTGSWAIIKDNIDQLKRVGQAPTNPGSPEPGQLVITQKP
ncbi:unnamed protein product [Pylaiella littoralis]